MKDQYFGDVNDYRKYGLLRGLSQEGHFRLGVCWMLTPNDGRSDGGFIEYLSLPGRWRQFDLPLFDSMKQALATAGGRRVAQVPHLGFLPGALFFDPLLSDQPQSRAEYFAATFSAFANAEVIFFDPDNGLEVRSRPYGSKGSTKYLYWREASEGFARGHSLLIYQHFPRQKRSSFLTQMGRAISDHTQANHVYAATTSNVCFFLAVQASHAMRAEHALRSISRRWSGQITFVPDLAA